MSTLNLVPSIEDFYEGRSILITGASGFIGKQLLEKLLRSCPRLKSIYVLLRSNKHHAAKDRLQHLLNSAVSIRTLLLHHYSMISVSEVDLKHLLRCWQLTYTDWNTEKRKLTVVLLVQPLQEMKRRLNY